MKLNLRLLASHSVVLALAAATLVAAALAAQLVISRRSSDSRSTAGAIDWARVTERDLNIASVFLVARDRGVGAALDSLERLVAGDGKLRVQGHPLAHALGRYAMANRRDLSLLGECTPSFQSGCFHGALEGYFLQGGTVDPASAGRICGAQGTRGFELLECWHGLGHGLMVHFAGDLRKALAICDALETAQARRECQDGVFMERVVRAVGVMTINVGDGPGMGAHAHGGSAESGEHGGHADAQAGGHGAHAAAPAPVRAASRQELLRLCERVDERHQPSCWAYQPAVLIRVHGVKPAAVLRGCDAAPARAVRDCYQGFGKQLLGANAGNVAAMIAGCQRGNRAYATDCLMGGVEYFTDLDWTIEPGIAFCRQVPGDAKPRCYGMIGARLALAHADQEPIRAACAEVESPFAGACLAGAGIRES